MTRPMGGKNVSIVYEDVPGRVELTGTHSSVQVGRICVAIGGRAKDYYCTSTYAVKSITRMRAHLRKLGAAASTDEKFCVLDCNFRAYVD